MLKNLALLQKVAPNLGLKLTEKPVKSTDDIDRVLFSVATKDNTVCASLALFAPAYLEMPFKEDCGCGDKNRLSFYRLYPSTRK